MSLDVTAPERVCYVHCNLCNTILAVSVPCSSVFNIVTVRCGHCANLLSVNVGSLLQTLPFQDLQVKRPVATKRKKNDCRCGFDDEILFDGGNKQQNHSLSSQDYGRDCGSSSKCNRISMLAPNESDQPLPIRPPEKRQRVPSAYNRFIKEEIQRIKASNPEISHREAFSTAAKNWAHFPHIHFGLNIDGSKQPKIDEAFAGEVAQKTQGFY